MQNQNEIESLTREQQIFGAIQPQQNISLHEKVDLRALSWLLEHPEDCGDLSEWEHVRTYTRLMDPVTKTIPIVYSKRSSDGTDGNLKGRLFANGGVSLQSFSKRVRHTLGGSLCHDLDIKNCFPTLLIQICREHDIQCPELESYVANREEKIADVIKALHDQQRSIVATQSDVKNLFLSILNGGSWDGWCKETLGISDGQDTHWPTCPPTVASFAMEAQLLRDALWDEPDFQECRRIGEANHHDDPTKDAKGSALSVYLGEIENNVLMAIANACQLSGWEVGVYVFDGLMVAKKSGDCHDGNNDDVEQLLLVCEQAALASTGYAIKLVKKPMDLGVEIPATFQPLNPDIGKLPFVHELGNYKEVYWASWLYPIVEDNVRVHGEKCPLYFMFNEKTKVWEQTDGCSQVVKLIHDKLHERLKQLANVVFKMSSIVGAHKQVQTLLKKAVERSTDSAFLERVARQLGAAGCKILDAGMFFNRNHPELISVRNGMVDVRTLKLIPRTKEHLFTYFVDITIPEDWLDVIRLRVNDEIERSKNLDEDTIDCAVDCAVDVKGNIDGSLQMRDLATPPPLTLEEIRAMGIELGKHRDKIPLDDPDFFDKLFGNDIFNYDPENPMTGKLIALTVQIMLGYAITGFTEHQIFPYFHGRGSNGKSLLDKMMDQLTPIYRSISYDALCSKDKNNDELYDAVYARLLSVNETDAGDNSDHGRQLNWVTLKHITGGDKLSVSAKFKGVLQFNAAFTLIISSNYKLQLPQCAKLAEKRRPRPVPFKRTYLNPDDIADIDTFKQLKRKGKLSLVGWKDPQLEAKVQSRKLGFILWVLQGAYKYCQNGRRIPMPDCLQKHIKKSVLDAIMTPEQFFEANFEIVAQELDEDEWISTTDILQEYLALEDCKVEVDIKASIFGRRISKHVLQCMKQAPRLIKGRQGYTNVMKNVRHR